MNIFFVVEIENAKSLIFSELRNLVVEIVLATDMSTHFVQIKTMKNMLTLPEGLPKFTNYFIHSRARFQELTKQKRSASLFTLVICKFINDAFQRQNTLFFVFSSHASKPWELHHRWTEGVLEEFFRQVRRRAQSKTLQH